MTKNDVTLVIIAKNEAKGLKRAVYSVRELVYETIIAVDTASTDDTLQIARELTPNVFQYNWPGSFSQARNDAAKAARTGYILWLDGHEFLEGKIDYAEIENGDNDGFLIKVKLDSGMILLQPRILRKDVQYQGKIHNEPQLKSTKILKSGLIVHDRAGGQAADAIEARNIQRDEMMTRIMGVDFRRNQNDLRACYHLAQFYHSKMQFKKAIKLYEHYLKRNKDLKEQFVMHVHAAMCLISMRKFKDAEKSLKKAQRECGEMWEFSFLLATIKIRQQKHREAIGHLIDSMATNQTTQRYFPFERKTAQIWDQIANEFYQTSNYEEAAEAWKRAAELQQDPIAKKLMSDRTDLMVKMAVEQRSGPQHLSQKLTIDGYTAHTPDSLNPK